MSGKEESLDFYTKGTRAWVEDVLEGWARVTVTSPVKDGQLVVEKELTGELISIKVNKEKSNLPPLDNPAMLQNVDDLTTLSYLHEPAVLENVKVRYAQHIVYTYSGIVLVAMNPFQKLNIYGQDMVQAYAGKQKGDLEPHLFSVAEDAYRSMVREARNQSIIVTGESGAGKTVSTKFVMRYFATVDSDSAKMSDVEEQVMATNPIMESFGNAKTIRNNNSSRFGKYIELKFSDRFKITAANIRTYLLERSRVVFQAQDERNYHIFYQLCAGAPAAEREELGLGNGFEDFHYLRQGGNGQVDDMDDAHEFHETQNGLSKIGISVTQQWTIFKLLAGVLHLGNIEITVASKRSTDATISSTDPSLLNACRLLGLKLEDLVKWICRRMIQTGKETIMKNRDAEEAKGSRDAIAKFIYAKLFDWLVFMVNKSLDHPVGSTKKLFIGLLDIYGFEIFKVNSFEQFCINYANEKLQQEFVQHVFKLEQQEYVREGIKWSFIDYRDNQPCIDLIEGKLGILGLLDEECRLPKGSDESFVNKLLSGLKDHPFFAKPRFSGLAFIVKHYAQDVCYEVAGFLDKNKDTISDEQMDVLLATTEPLYLAMFSDPKAPKREKGGPQTTMKATLGSTFKASLNALMETLRSTYPNFIRCIKPNEKKQAFLFEPVHVLQQLRACGVLETIRISAAGYPSRTNFVHFAERYRPLAPRNLKLTEDGREYCKGVLDFVVKDEDKYQVGKTKIFLRAGQLAILERLRLNKLNQAAVMIQKHFRRMRAVKRYRKIKIAAGFAQKIVRGFLARRLYKRMRRSHACKTIQRVWRGHRVRKAVKDLLFRIKTIQIAIRARSAKKVLATMRLRNSAIKIQSVWRGYVARRLFKRKLRAIVYMQCCLRRRKARFQLKLLKIEARSLTKYKEVSYRLENKVVELTQILNEEKNANKQLHQKNDSLQEEILSLRQKVETFKPYKEKYESTLAVKNDLEKQLDELLKSAQKEKQDLARKLSEREATLQQKEADYDRVRTQLEADKKQLKEAYEALKVAHQNLLNEVSKEKQEFSEKFGFQNDRISRLQAELDRSSKELSIEKKKTEELLVTIDKLQNDTTELDALRKVIVDQQEEAERQRKESTEMLQAKVDALKVVEEERVNLTKELRAKEEKINRKDVEHARVVEQLELTKKEISRLMELNETIQLEKAHLTKLKAEADALKESLVAAQADLKKTNKKLEEANAEIRITLTSELNQKDELLRRKDEAYEQLRRNLEAEQRENSSLKEKMIRLESLKEASEQASELKASLTSSLEETNSELKKMNMNLMETLSRERDEAAAKLEQREEKIEKKNAQIREVSLELEKEKREVQRLQDASEALKRESELKAEAAALKASMNLQELQLQVKMLQQHLEQQQSLLQEESQKNTSSNSQLATLEANALSQGHEIEKLNFTIESLKRDHDAETRALKELLASKSAEVEKTEKRYKDELAALEAKLEEERKAINNVRRNTKTNMFNEPPPQATTIEKEWTMVKEQTDWALSHQDDQVRASLGGEFERDLVGRLITRLKVPLYPPGEKPKSASEVLFPAHTIGLALSRMKDLQMESNFQSLIVASLRAINSVAQLKKEDPATLCFWFSNTIELRSVVYTLTSFGPDGKEVPLSKALAKLLNDLGHEITELFHLFFQKIKQPLVKIVPQALLIHNSLASTSGFSRFLRSSGPTPETITQFLSEIKQMVECYHLEEAITRHLFSNIMYTIGTEAFNNLLLKKEFCTPNKGMSIRYNVTILEEWCQKNGFSETILHFQTLSQAAVLLQQPHQNTSDLEAILDTCFLLNAVQVYKLLTNYRDEMDRPISEENLKFVYDRTLASEDDSLLEQGHHALFEKPPLKFVYFEPFNPPGVPLEDILAKLKKN